MDEKELEEKAEQWRENHAHYQHKAEIKGCAWYGLPSVMLKDAFKAGAEWRDKQPAEKLDVDWKRTTEIIYG